MTALALRPRTGHRRPTLHLDPAAITANVRTVRSRTPGEVMAVVKADGYGHGQVAVARAALAGGATRLGVTSIAEALPLRAAGLTVRVLSWLNPVDAEFDAAVRLGVELAVPGLDHLDAIARSAVGARIHLHLDTTMGRDGAAPADWDRLCRAAREAERSGVLRVVGVMGHLPCADRPGHPGNTQGIARFAWGLRVARAAGLRPADRHLAATAATLGDPRTHHTMSRIGAGLVGIDESRTTRLRPALRLTAPLVTVRDVPAGTPVGYGHTWTAPRRTRLGLLRHLHDDRGAGWCGVVVQGPRQPPDEHVDRRGGQPIGVGVRAIHWPGRRVTHGPGRPPGDGVADLLAVDPELAELPRHVQPHRGRQVRVGPEHRTLADLVQVQAGPDRVQAWSEIPDHLQQHARAGAAGRLHELVVDPMEKPRQFLARSGRRPRMGVAGTRQSPQMIVDQVRGHVLDAPPRAHRRARPLLRLEAGQLPQQLAPLQREQLPNVQARPDPTPVHPAQ